MTFSRHTEQIWGYLLDKVTIFCFILDVSFVSLDQTPQKCDDRKYDVIFNYRILPNFESSANHNKFHNILRLFNILPNFPFTTSEMMYNCYLQVCYLHILAAWRVAEQLKILDQRKLGNKRKVSKLPKLHRNIAQRPVPPPKIDLANTSRKLLKSRCSTLPVALFHIKTSVSNSLWMIVSGNIFFPLTPPTPLQT